MVSIIKRTIDFVKTDLLLLQPKASLLSELHAGGLAEISDNRVTIMKEKIDAYFLQVQHLADPMVRAQIMLDLLNTEHGENCKSSEAVNSETTLDEALDRFYTLKECQYVKALLEHYVDNGTFELPAQKQDAFQRLDRFKHIKSVLTELLPVKIDNKQNA